MALPYQIEKISFYRKISAQAKVVEAIAVPGSKHNELFHIQLVSDGVVVSEIQGYKTIERQA
jgi:hypothetical protein